MCETQLDNVAPKVIALVGLSEDSDTQQVRQALVENCLMNIENQKKADKQRTIEEILEADDHQSQFKAYMCPNPGSNSNMSSKKQRLIFVEMNREDPYSVLDVSKSIDMVIVVMSCKKTNVTGVKQDPFEHGKAIDETGYRALSLIR
jgi:hypothetical protein